MDILVEEYSGGWVLPYGEKSKIARRLGCSLPTLSKLDGGGNLAWTEELSRRRQQVIPLLHRDARAALLQHILQESMTEKQRAGRPLSSKDPVDIIAELRKDSQPVAGRIEATQNIYQQNIFGVDGLSDEKLSRKIEMVEQLLRMDDDTIGAMTQLLEEKEKDELDGDDIIEGQFADAAPRVEVGEHAESTTQGEETPDE
jgi:hypothetical protein